MNRKMIIINTAVLALGLVLGALIFGGGDGDGEGRDREAAGEHADHAGQEAASTWTCAMHPQIQRPKPGKCPICAMDLIPVGKGGGTSQGPRELTMTEEARQLARVATVPVTRQLVEAEVRLVGKVDYDETQTKTVSAWFPARIDRLYVDYTGIAVHKGDHLAHVYSPELLTAQQELLSAIKFQSGDLNTIRDKLRLWGLSEEMIKAIEERGETTDRLDIDTPLGGIIIQKNINEGGYVKTGDPMFRIADLSKVWVQLDAYESDLPWLRYGQEVEFEAEAIPGKKFTGTIAFISPTLDPVTRTVKVRVNAENPNFELKPEMFVHARAFSTMAGAGKVVAPELAGKWISPMHPEIIRDEPGDCPICGMKLVKAEDLGYTILQPSEKPPLVVPTSAVLKTGRRSLVYVELPDKAQPTFEGREIVVGPRAGDYYVVEEGLAEGEHVVVQGNFKIDSALQILAKPSMMNPEGGGGGGGHRHGGQGTGSAAEPASGRDGESAMAESEDGAMIHWHPEAAEAGQVLATYLEVQAALAADDLSAAKAAAGAAISTISAERLKDAVAKLSKTDSIATARAQFKIVSDVLLAAAERGELPATGPLYRLHCPMAFDLKGADWIQATDEVRNPYFGAEMLECGSVKRKLD